MVKVRINQRNRIAPAPAPAPITRARASSPVFDARTHPSAFDQPRGVGTAMRTVSEPTKRRLAEAAGSAEAVITLHYATVALAICRRHPAGHPAALGWNFADRQGRIDLVTKSTRTTRPATRRATASDVDDLVTAVLTASQALVGVSARSLAGVEDTVTITQFRTLVVLENRGQTNLNTLADDLDVNSSTAMRMIDRLLMARLVTRIENPANRREVLLGLTDDGTELVETVTRRRRAEIAGIVTAMPLERRTELVAALRAFAAAAAEPLRHGASMLGW